MVNKFLYGEMTWPEIRDIAKENRVALLPAATIFDQPPDASIISNVSQ